MNELDLSTLLGESGKLGAPEKIECPELGGYIYIRDISVVGHLRLREAFQRQDTGEMGDDELMAFALELAICDEEGHLRLGSGDGMKVISAHGRDPMETIFAQILEKNGMTVSVAEEDKKKLEEEIAG